MSASDDCVYMQRALELAQQGMGRTSPNPPVGCVVVRNSEVIAEGYHQKAGLDHAEIDALKKVRGSATGARSDCWHLPWGSPAFSSEATVNLH